MVGFQGTDEMSRWCKAAYLRWVLCMGMKFISEAGNCASIQKCKIGEIQEDKFRRTRFCEERITIMFVEVWWFHGVHLPFGEKRPWIEQFASRCAWILACTGARVMKIWFFSYRTVKACADSLLERSAVSWRMFAQRRQMKASETDIERYVSDTLSKKHKIQSPALWIQNCLLPPNRCLLCTCIL